MYLGLDFGTSGARACLIDGQATIAHEDRVDYPAQQQQTPLDWREALLLLLHRIPAELAAQLQGIAIDATSATTLLCDADLKPLSPPLMYSDTRASAEAEELKSIAPPGHIVCSATSGLAKFLWLTRQTGSEHAAYFLHQADWLTALLSGQPGISDYHNVLKTGYDVAALRWPDWVMSMPLAHLLPEAREPGIDIDRILPDIATHFGINPGCRIHAGTTDSTAAFIATGVQDTGIGVTSLGTTLVLKQLSEKRIDSPEYGVYSHRYGDLWLVGGASNAGAGILRQYFSDAQIEMLSALIDPSKDSPLDYYPLSQPGERFPVSDPQLAPRIEPRPGSDVEFLHGLLQGLSRIEASGYAKLRKLGAPRLQRVVTAGGGARNETWRKLRARYLGLPVTNAAHSEAAFGCALLSAGSACPAQ